jgi:hypothetical protein
MQTNARMFRIAATVLVAAVLAACQSPAPRPTAPHALELIGSAPLNLPQSCSASGTVVVDFTVLEDGRTDRIQPAAAAPACVQEALTAWVASFRYAPPASDTRTSVEWLLVEAKKGS